MSAAVTLKTQNTIFSSEVLPTLFHDAPDQFMYYLNRDGNRFLRFYWDQTGQKAGEASSSYGLNYLTRPLSGKGQFAMVFMPEVCEEFDAYYVGLIHRPSRRIPFSPLADTSRVVVLERVYGMDGSLQTRLCDIDRHIHKEVIGPGPEPAQTPFLLAVQELLQNS